MMMRLFIHIHLYTQMYTQCKQRPLRVQSFYASTTITITITITPTIAQQLLPRHGLRTASEKRVQLRRRSALITNQERRYRVLPK